MIRIFKRTRPTPTPAAVISIEDLRVARWFGYTPEQWSELPALVLVDKREEFFHVQGLAS